MTDDVALSSMPSLSETGWSVDSVDEWNECWHTFMTVLPELPTVVVDMTLPD